MRLSAPAFWWQPRPSPAARLLAPLGTLYHAATMRRMARTGLQLSVPVVCVGNFVAGGAGKTPLTLALARQLLAEGHRPVVLSRGYGGRAQGTPLLVDAARHDVADVGDEALLLTNVAPTVVGADRRATAVFARTLGATHLILDDGFQNPALVHDLRIAVVDGAHGVGNGLCIPAGPLRARLEAQLPSISALVVVGDGAMGRAVAQRAVARGKPVFHARLEPDAAARSLEGQKVFAFAGIGLPQKFFATLRGLGADVVGTRSFADHRPYTSAGIAKLQAEAARHGALPVTTAKDFARIAPFLDRLSGLLPRPVAVDLVFETPAAFFDLVSNGVALKTRS